MERKMSLKKEDQIKGALEGLNVLDLTRFAPGPYCTMILGDLGADVIKVEEVGSLTERHGEQMKGIDTRVSVREFAPADSPYDPLNRNKRSLGLNLKTKEAKHIFYQLVERTDVVVEGFRPGVTKKLGIDYQILKEINEGIIYCAITGYGQDGPYRNLVGHDINYISQGGAAGIMRHSESVPPIPGNLIGDMAAGGMQAAIGILAALMARTRTGRGQLVDIAMTDGVLSLLSLYMGGYLKYGQMPCEEDRVSTGRMPYYNYYRTKDGKLISIACAPEPWFYANLCKVLGCENFIPYQGKKEKVDEIRAYFEHKFLTKTRDEWFDILAESDIPVGKVYSLGELEFDPQLKHRGMIVELEHPTEGKIKQPGIAIKLSETPGAIRKFSPVLGEHTYEILVELGYSKDQIQRFQEDGIAGTRAARGMLSPSQGPSGNS